MSLPYNRALIPRARELRQNATPQEIRLWEDYLRSLPIRFQRQKVIGNFIADFYCAKAHLIIELDGSQHRTPDGLIYDAERDGLLSQYGVRVLRIPNHAIDTHFPEVCARILREIEGV